MEIILRRNITKRTLMLLVVGGFILLVAWVTKTYVASVVSSKPTVKNLELAIKLDPGNSQYRLLLGRLFQYNVPDIDLDRATRLLTQAVETNPLDPRGWLNLAGAFEMQGKVEEADACLRRADSLGPHIPALQWTIANSYLLHGETDEAFRHFKVILGESTNYNQIIFDLGWKASGDPAKILDQLIPRRMSAELDYLHYLFLRQRYPEAWTVWKRITASSEKFVLGQVAWYIDGLIAAHKPEDAYQVWIDLGHRALIPRTDETPNGNLLKNGDFEEGIINKGFDWRFSPLERVYVLLDQNTYRSPGHALLIQFTGKRNLDYRRVYRYVNVKPGRAYGLRAFMKTEDITTDSGPRFEVRDAYDSSALDKFSENLVGTTPGWVPLVLNFKTGPKTELIEIRVARLPSRKLDNQITGKVWIDDVSLTEQPEKEILPAVESKRKK